MKTTLRVLSLSKQDGCSTAHSDIAVGGVTALRFTSTIHLDTSLTSLILLSTDERLMTLFAVVLASNTGVSMSCMEDGKEREDALLRQAAMPRASSRGLSYSATIDLSQNITVHNISAFIRQYN